MLRFMGWKDYSRAVRDHVGFAHFHVDLPEGTTLEGLCKHIKGVLNLNGVRFVGDLEKPVRKVALVGHICPQPFDKRD